MLNFLLCLSLNFQSLARYAYLNVFSSHAHLTHPKLNHPLSTSNSVMLVYVKPSLESLILVFPHFYLINLLASVPSTGKDSDEQDRHGSCPQGSRRLFYREQLNPVDSFVVLFFRILLYFPCLHPNLESHQLCLDCYNLFLISLFAPNLPALLKD